MKIGLLLAFSLIAVISCSTQEVCDDVLQSDAVLRLKINNSEPVRDTLVPGVSIYGIRDGRPDSLLYDSATLSRVLLPLDPHHSNSEFVVRVNELADTLRILHTAESYLVSYSCGFASMFTIGDVEHSTNVIQHYEIVKSIIDAELDQDEEHLWIYF